jgi:DNA-binding transcriptional MerR regulator
MIGLEMDIMAESTPIYNLKAVIKETGLNPATLRAWERRYGLLKPLRSPGGHRLYSRQDINLLKWLVARQNEGLSISSAVEMWRIQGENNQGQPAITSSSELNADGKDMIDALRERWLEACLAFDEQGSKQILDQAFALAAPETICMEVLQKGLAQLGQGWYAGLVSVQQEHFASAIAMRRLDALLAAEPATTRPETILIACPPGEEHAFILLMITYLLRRSGWHVLYLGSDLPLEKLDLTIKTTRPSLVLSAAQTLPGAASLGEMSGYLLSLGIPLAYGGGIFDLVPPARHYISGYYLGTNLGMLSEIIALLVIAPPEMPSAQPISPEYTQALVSFSQKESVILAGAISIMQGGTDEPDQLSVASTYFPRLITSALRLGDIHLLDHPISWLNGLLKNYGFSAKTTAQFYDWYLQAIVSNLGPEGKLILNWFEMHADG